MRMRRNHWQHFRNNSGRCVLCKTIWDDFSHWIAACDRYPPKWTRRIYTCTSISSAAAAWYWVRSRRRRCRRRWWYWRATTSSRTSNCGARYSASKTTTTSRRAFPTTSSRRKQRCIGRFFICQQSYLLLFGIPSPTHSFLSRLKTSLLCKSFPLQPFLSCT